MMVFPHSPHLKVVKAKRPKSRSSIFLQNGQHSSFRLKLEKMIHNTETATARTPISNRDFNIGYWLYNSWWFREIFSCRNIKTKIEIEPIRAAQDASLCCSLIFLCNSLFFMTPLALTAQGLCGAASFAATAPAPC
jgi:hypothetical protein